MLTHEMGFVGYNYFICRVTSVYYRRPQVRDLRYPEGANRNQLATTIHKG